MTNSYRNTHPITVHADHDGLTVRGRTDTNPRTGNDGTDFALLLNTHAEVILFTTHLQIANDDYQDADPIGTLFVDGLPIGKPLLMARLHMTWTTDPTPQGEALVIVSGDVPGAETGSNLGLSLDLATVTRLRADLKEATRQVPADAEFHVWSEQPGRLFDPSGGRDWVFERYLREPTTI